MNSFFYRLQGMALIAIGLPVSLAVVMLMPLVAHSAAVEFIYQRGSANSPSVYYRNEIIDYHGVAARAISWRQGDTLAYHLLRLRDNRPLYTRRTSAAAVVEVVYGRQSGDKTLYTRTTGEKRVRREIEQQGL